ADQNVGQFLLRAGDGDGEPVKQALLGAFDKIVRQVAPSERGGTTGEFGSDGNGLHALSSSDPPRGVSGRGMAIVYRRCRMASGRGFRNSRNFRKRYVN